MLVVIENLMIKNFLLYGSLILAAYHSKHQITNDGGRSG
jgi:hypothetical protein